jgi:hypothetical protein
MPVVIDPSGVRRRLRAFAAGRRPITLGFLVVVLAMVAPAPATAAQNARFGVQDDAWLIDGPGSLDNRLGTLDDLGVKLVRVTVRWDEIAPTRPLHERNPHDPAYVWGAFARTLQQLHARRIAVLATIWGSPRWANAGHPPSWLPRSGLGNFAYAASKRFPWIRLWTIWNEPNTSRFSHPVSPLIYTRRLLNPAYALLHLANRANHVAGGVTSPRRTPGGMAPYDFMKGMRRYHAHLDAYAQNPYPGSSRATPFHSSCPWCRSLTMARLSSISTDVTGLFGRKPIWLTEYGYQTDPPDHIIGVPRRLQATYVGEAALRVWEQTRVTILIHFLVRDEPDVGGWQSGFFTVHGTAKPSYRAFGLPFAQISREGARTLITGQVRPGSGRRPYSLQRWTGRSWRRIGGPRFTSTSGRFTRLIRARQGERVRLSTPVVAYTSPPLRLT